MVLSHELKLLTLNLSPLCAIHKFFFLYKTYFYELVFYPLHGIFLSILRYLHKVQNSQTSEIILTFIRFIPRSCLSTHLLSKVLMYLACLD